MDIAPTEIEPLLRACLRLHVDRAGGAWIAAGLRDLGDDGGTLRAAIEAERIGPLLHKTVGQWVAPSAAAVLKESYYATGMRNLLLRRELGTCLQALAAAAVPAIVLKGAALIETVYHNVSLRPMGDADLLVRRADVAVTRQVLEHLGYQAGRGETRPGALTEYENEMAFCKPGRINTWVDVHWSLFDSPYYQDRLAMDWFWESARPATIAEMPTLVLGPEALVIHLCGHLALHHTNTGLLWWYDVAAVLTRHRDEIDWRVLLSRTSGSGLIPPVRSVLLRVADEWGAPIPPVVLEALRGMRESPAERRIFAELTAGQRSPRQRFWSDLTSMSDWRQRWRFARTNLVPSPDYMRRRYAIAHPLLVPLSYPYRWLRGALGLG
jgi:Uncharacterised nucleotidyltransferase